MAIRNNNSRDLPRAIDFGGWFLAILLLFGGLQVNGCATMGMSRAGERDNASDMNGRLPFPSSRNRNEKAVDSGPTVVGYSEYRDPLSGFNKAVFAFNDVTYRYLLIPAAKGYVRVTPRPVRRSVNNFFYNLKTPVFAVNHLLQLNPGAAGRDLLRFGINSTVGLLGLFDPARSRLGIEREETHLDDTLAEYRVGYGIYLVLPIFGPSDIRNTVSIVSDHFLNPVTYLDNHLERTLIEGSDFFQNYAPAADRYIILRNKSENPYIFFRNLYLQGIMRDADY